MVYQCKKCNLIWYYPIEKCTYCKGEVLGVEEKEYTVQGFTEVFIASKYHPDVPYYDLLLEDENKNFHIKKSFKKYEIRGTIANENKGKKLKEKIGVIGAGVMGTDIAQIFAFFGFEVVLIDRKREFLDNAIQKIEKELQKSLSDTKKNEIIRNIKITTDTNELKDAVIIIEAISEDINAKKQLFKELDKILSNKIIIATNTSSLSVDELASVVSGPERFVGMHFFNPVSKMNLIEVIRGEKTSGETINKINEFSKQINKTAIIVKNSPGFIVNRILIILLNEALWELYEGVASVEDIDSAVRLGLNHPIGPFVLIDLIGLDVVLAIMNSLYQRTKNKKYLPCPIIEKMVKEKKLGRKTKEGFYKY